GLGGAALSAAGGARYRPYQQAAGLSPAGPGLRYGRRQQPPRPADRGPRFPGGGANALAAGHFRDPADDQQSRQGPRAGGRGRYRARAGAAQPAAQSAQRALSGDETQPVGAFAVASASPPPL